MTVIFDDAIIPAAESARVCFQEKSCLNVPAANNRRRGWTMDVRARAAAYLSHAAPRPVFNIRSQLADIERN